MELVSVLLRSVIKIKGTSKTSFLSLCHWGQTLQPGILCGIREDESDQVLGPHVSIKPETVNH